MSATRADASPGLGEIQEHFARAAASVDRGERSTRGALRFLGERDLLAVDVGVGDDGDGPLREMVAVIDAVARSCMSSAFSVWAQRMMIEYLAVADAGFDVAGLGDDLARGRQAGSTAMASAFADFAGLAPLPVTFTRHGTDLRLDGTVRWSSNLFDDGFWVALAARGADGERIAVALPSSTPGLHAGPGPELLALNATASSSLRLEGVTVPASQVISRDLGAFLTTVRRPFLCLQTAFCLGLAQASLDAVLARPNAGYGQFSEDRDHLVDQIADVVGRLDELAVGASGAANVAPLLTVRLDAARLAWTAVTLEVKVTGGSAYRADSPTARRLREAAFLPIQSPTEAHLRWELAACTS